MMASARCPMEWCASCPRSRIDVGVSIKKELDALMMAIGRCMKKWCPFVVINSIDVGMSIKKRRNLIHPALSSSRKKRKIQIWLRGHDRSQSTATHSLTDRQRAVSGSKNREQYQEQEQRAVSGARAESERDAAAAAAAEEEQARDKDLALLLLRLFRSFALSLAHLESSSSLTPPAYAPIIPDTLSGIVHSFYSFSEYTHIDDIAFDIKGEKLRMCTNDMERPRRLCEWCRSYAPLCCLLLTHCLMLWNSPVLSHSRTDTLTSRSGD